MLVKRMIGNYSNYEISNHGNVKNVVTGKILKYRSNKNGFAMCLLTGNDGNRHWMNVQDLMIEYFNDDELELYVGIKIEYFNATMNWSFSKNNIIRSKENIIDT